MAGLYSSLKRVCRNDGAGRVLYFADFGAELVLQEVILGAKRIRLQLATFCRRCRVITEAVPIVAYASIL